MTDTTSMPAPAISLEHWIEQHGALSVPAALLVGLDALAHATALSHRELATTIASLHPSRMTRREGDGWRWTPLADSEASHSTRVGDIDIVERIGVVLFYALTGRPVGDTLVAAPSLRARLNGLRPDLAPWIADLIVRATLIRYSRHRLTPSALALELRRPLAAATDDGRPGLTRTPVLAISALVGLAGLFWFAARASGGLESHGLTRDETTVLDVHTEAAETLALMDEHTASFLLHQHLRGIWRSHVEPGDPRLVSVTVHEAWVRTLAGDFLTAEQLLADGPRAFLQEFGERHPYTRGARLALAAVLERRGATREAAALSAAAMRTTRELLEDTRRVADVATEIPIGPGVVAHMAPALPEREGFRQTPEGFVAPLTSVQRMLAGRSGWRLHVVARDACRVSVDVGAVPRRVTVNLARTPDSSWQVEVSGVERAMKLRSSPAASASLAIVAGATGDIVAKLGEATKSSRIDTAGALHKPPFALTFRGAPAASACALVWLEIPFPFGPAESR